MPAFAASRRYLIIALTLALAIVVTLTLTRHGVSHYGASKGMPYHAMGFRGAKPAMVFRG